MVPSASQIWIVTVAVLAVALVVTSSKQSWRQSGWLLAIAFFGQACSLQLIYSPQNGMYEFYRPLGEVAGSWRLFCLVAVLAQGFYVFWTGRDYWRRFWEATCELLQPFQRILLVMFLFFAGLLVSTDGLQYGFGVFLVVWVAVVGALNLLLVVRAFPETDLARIKKFLKAFSAEDRSHRLSRWLPWLAAVWVVCVSAFIGRFVLEGVPHIQDSFSYFFQAKYFSDGYLYLPPPPDVASFRLDHMIIDGEKWYGYGFPGWALVLSLGVRSGVPWLVNPILGGLAVVLIHGLLKRIYDVKFAHAAVLLLALSPWFLAMSANYMNHTLCLVLGLSAIYATELGREGKSLLWGAVAGIFLGLLCLTRPLESIFLSGVVGLCILGLGGPRPPFKMIIPLVFAAILVGGMILQYNALLTGDPFLAPHMKWTDATWYHGADRLGFGPDIGNVGWYHQDPLPGHGPADVILNANKNTHVINFELFGWSFGSLLFVALAFLWKTWNRTDLLFWGMIAIVVGGYTFYWHPGGPDFGSRYWYPLILPSVVLTVRGIQVLNEKLQDFDAAKLITSRLVLFVALATAISFINVMPWRSMEKYYRYMSMSNDLASLAKEEGFDQGALVFVHVRTDDHYNDQKDYAGAMFYNPPTLNDPGTVYARYLSPDKQVKVMTHFPGRPVWHIAASPDHDGEYIVVKRPNRKP